MKQRTPLLLLSMLLLATSGCGIIPESKKIDYKTTTKLPSLEIPPDLTQLTKDDRFSVPDRAGKGSATFSAYAQDRANANTPGAQESAVLPKVDVARMERSGSQRWLVVRMSNDKIWENLKDFWQETGFIIKVERPEAGVMETDWAENRAKLPDDFIRRSLGKVLDSLYSTGERDKFRTRLEPGSEAGTVEVYISHRAMEEVYTSTAKDDTRWQPKAADPELEAEMLRRFMVRLGTEEQKATQALATPKAAEQAKIVRAATSAQLELQDRFDRAWRRVGLALDRVGFMVEDRDRAKGIYFVRYIDSDADAKKKDPGMLSKLAFWRDSKDNSADKTRYRVYVKDMNNLSTVQVLNGEGKEETSETTQRILTLLHEQLK